jgi:hypothetical protein
VPPDTAAVVSADLVEPKRKLPWPELALAALLLGASLGPIAWDLLRARGLSLPGGALIGRDFLNCWAGGQLVLHGEAARIYSSAYMPALEALTGQPPLSVHVFSYPPSLLLFLWPLGFLAYVPAFFLWIAGTGALWFCAARPWLRRAGLPAWTALALPAAFANVWAGHYGFVLAALWLAAFAALGKRPVPAGLALALLTFKPHMGVLIALVLLLRREWRVVAIAAAGTAALVAASMAAFGLDPWVYYLVDTSRLQAGLLARDNAFFFLMMPTPYAAFFRAFDSIAIAAAAQGLIAAAALIVLVRATLRGTAWPELGLLTATATFLVLPYAFNYDMGVVCLSAAMLLFGKGPRLDVIDRAFALLAFGSPILVFALTWLKIPLMPLALFGFLLVQARAYAPPRHLWKTAPSPLGSAQSGVI